MIIYLRRIRASISHKSRTVRDFSIDYLADGVERSPVALNGLAQRDGASTRQNSSKSYCRAIQGDWAKRMLTPTGLDLFFRLCFNRTDI